MTTVLKLFLSLPVKMYEMVSTVKIPKGWIFKDKELTGKAEPFIWESYEKIRHLHITKKTW